MRLTRILIAVFVTCLFLTPAFVRAQDDAVHAQTDVHQGEAHEDAHEEEGGSMPQLDATYYASQLFWLAVTGVFLYVVLARVALPGVSAVIERRDGQVRSDLELAYKLKQQAEDLKIAYSKALRDSDEKSKTLMEKTIRDMRDKQTKGLADANDRIAVKIKDSENHLRAQQNTLMDDSAMISERLAKSVMQELAKGRA